MSSKIEEIKKQLYEKLDALDKLKIEVKDLLKELPQNGDTEKEQEALDTIIDLLAVKLQEAAGQKKTSLEGEAGFTRLAKALTEIKKARIETDTELLLHLRKDKE